MDPASSSEYNPTQVNGHGFDFFDQQNFSLGMYSGGPSNRTTHLTEPSEYSTSLGATSYALPIPPQLPALTCALDFSSAPTGSFGDHQWSGDGVGPSSVTEDMEEPEVGRNVVKVEVASMKTKMRSAARRMKEANFTCPLPGCGDTFTKRHNMNSEYA